MKRHLSLITFATHALLATSVAFLGGCPEEQPAKEPTILMFAGGSGQFVSVANGSSVLQVLLNATDAEGNGDNGAISIDVEGGSLSATLDGFTEQAVRTLSLTPTAGGAEFFFRCDSGIPGSFLLNAANASTAASQTLTCALPAGTPTVNITNGCRGLSADGQTRCPITAEVFILSGGNSFPVADAVVEASVDVDKIVTTGVPNDVVLSGDEIGGLANSASVTTAADGTATLWVASPEVLLEQTMDVEITTTSGGVSQTTVLTVAIRPFVNASELTFNPTSLQVNGGAAPSNLTLNVLNPAGSVPRTNINTVESGSTVNISDRIYLSVQGNHTDITLASEQGVADDGSVIAVSGKEIVVATDENGLVPFTLATEVVTDSKSVTILASYQPIDDLDALTETLEVDVTPVGTLLVNGVVAPLEIASDENESAEVTVTVTLDGTPRAGATVVFTPANGDGDRIGFGIFPALETSHSITTDADGVASVKVSARNALVRGTGTVIANVTYDDAGTEREAYTEVSVSIVREPVLQSLIFLSADPEIIGVRGGAMQSSSLLKFKVLDDQNLPVAGAQVAFDVNTTAAPGATVSAAGTLTNADGEVEVVLSAGSQAGPITVVATATLNGNFLQVESGPVAVIGGLPTFGNSYMTCDTANIYRTSGFNTTCSVSLVDRFTDISTLQQVVHFRAEGGNITPAVLAGDGVATANFATGQPGIVGADTLGWSYGAILPRDRADLATDGDNNSNLRTADPEKCFDGDSNSPCDLIELCGDADPIAFTNVFYCPLPASKTNPDEGCWVEIASALGAYETFLTNNAGFSENAFRYATVHGFKTVVDDVLAVQENCGIPLPCLIGEKVMFGFLSQPVVCPAALGCYDFDPTTPCPQSGLRTIFASTRGEESFVDTNGNGVFDYDDANGNFTHDPGETSEPWVDMPEPFLDKNDNCGRNDYTGHPRMSIIEQIANTDLFSDEDGSQTFGYRDPVTGAISETNGKWDRDKEIFFQAHMVSLLGDANDAIHYGERCNAPGTDATCTDGTTGFCKEVAPGVYLSQECADARMNTELSATDSYQISFVFADANGNSFTPGFASEAAITGNLLSLGGLLEFEIGESNATLSSLGSARRNARRPWCQEAPNLGADIYDIQVSLDCAGIAADFLADASISLSFTNGSDDGFNAGISLLPKIDRISCCDLLTNPPEDVCP